MGMPRILIFKETLLPLSETFILAQTSSLSSFEPHFIGLEAVPGGLRLPHDPLLLSSETSRLASLRAKLYRRLHWATRFHEGARSLRPVLIHAHFASGGLTALTLARALGIPLVVTLHGNDITCDEQPPRSYKPLIAHTALFLCVSDYIRRRALACGIPQEKLAMHYIGIDRSIFSSTVPLDRRRGVLFIGRLVEKKGCEYLIRAMANVQKLHRDASLTIVGDGPLRVPLECLAVSLGVDAQFSGFQIPGVIRSLLSETRVLCAPSVTAANGDSEGLPTVLAEAQAMGVPVVSTFHSGIPELVVSGETGTLVPERDEESLATALSELLADPLLWNRFHEAAPRRIAAHFDLHRQTALLEQYYRRVLALSESIWPAPSWDREDWHTNARFNIDPQ